MYDRNQIFDPLKKPIIPSAFKYHLQELHRTSLLTFDFTECTGTKSVTKQIVAYLNLVRTA